MNSRFLKGSKIMFPFALILLLLVGGAFTLLYLREQAQHESNLEAYAHSMAANVLAVRTIFAENQNRINYDSEGRFEFKNLNPSAAANAFIAKTNGFRGKKVKQTSLLYRKDEDAPDDWEMRALASFETDRRLTRISETVAGETTVFRYAIPLYIEPNCLQCHGEPKGTPDITGHPREGYKLGDLRGAITVAIPLEDYYAARNGRIMIFICLVAGIILIILIVEQQMVEMLQRMANTDRLTKVYNRNMLYDSLQREIVQAQTYRTPLSVLMFDIDHFKRVNDEFGHLAGDEVLKNTAVIARGILRQGDILARFGGEEFVIVTLNTGESGALAMAERLRMKVAEAMFTHEKNQIRITISVGVTTLAQGHNHEDVVAIRDSLLNQADQALYRAKKSGRNRVEAYV